MNSKFFNFIFITENNPLNLNRNQLEEFLKYVQRRYHSHFNEKNIAVIDYLLIIAVNYAITIEYRSKVSVID